MGFDDKKGMDIAYQEAVKGEYLSRASNSEGFKGTNIESRI